MKTQFVIDYVNAMAGAGKTYGAAAKIASMIAAGEKVLLVQPTDRLIQATVDTTFPAMGVPMDRVTRITTHNAPQKVVEKIIQHILQAKRGEGECLVITHAAFILMAGMYQERRRDWIVIMDEAPEVQAAFSLNLPNTHHLLTHHMSVTTDDPVFWQVEPRPGSNVLAEMAANKLGDDVYSAFQEFASRLVSPYWRVWVKADTYTTMTRGADVDGVKRQLNAFAILTPDIFADFKRVIIMGAMFDRSFCYLIWKSLPNYTRVSFRNITKQFTLRYDEHPNGELLTVYYAQDRHFSKSLREKEVGLKDGKRASLFDALISTAQDMYAGQEGIALLANNDRAEIEEKFIGGERLPAYSHGINTYQHLNHAVLLIACNPSGQHHDFLKIYLDLSDDDIRTAMHRSVVYQAACRISVRDPQNFEPKSMFVPDRETAGWLAEAFPGSSVEKIEGIFDLETTGEIAKRVGRPKVRTDKTERDKVRNENKRWKNEVLARRQVRLQLINHHNVANRHHQLADDLRSQMTELNNVHAAPVRREDSQGTFFADRRRTEGRADLETSLEGLMGVFRQASAQTLATKDEGMMWSPTIFDPKAKTIHGTKAGYGNVIWARHIMLDNDGLKDGAGALPISPEQFAAILPGVRMLVHSTWSSTPANPKWRVLIPTDHVMDIESYYVIVRAIIAHVVKAGFPQHGFDDSKLKVTDRFYLPCVGPNGGSFMVDHAGEERKPLEVYEWTKRAPIEPEPKVMAPMPVKPVVMATGALGAIQAALLAAPKVYRPDLAQEALDEWHSYGNRAGARDAGFWQLGVGLRKAQCDEFEWKSHMKSACIGRPELAAKILRIWLQISK